MKKTIHKFQIFEHFLILTSTLYWFCYFKFINFNIRLVIC